MTRRELLSLTPFAFAPVLFTACGSEPEKKVEKPVLPVSGLHAIYRSYQKARTQWAADVELLSCSSIDVDTVKREAGMAPAWQSVFVSPSLGQKRAWNFSVCDAGISLREGVFPESAMPWSSDKDSFVLSVLQTDTDKALEVALAHGAKYASTHKDMPISFQLEMGRQTREPVWRVIWGENVSTSSFSVVVSAASGAYVTTLA